MSAAEFAEWMAYYRLDPFGEDRADLRTGILASVLANLFGGRRAGRFKPLDFMPKFDRKRRQTSTEMYRKLRAMYPPARD